MIFNEHGWFPNRNIYAISQLVYEYILPAMIAFEGGRRLGGGYMLVLPVLEIFTAVISEGMYFLVSHQMEPLLSIVIEPAKIFFLNNVINHGILVPLAMGELWEKGSSVLFLMETNPGPGFGMLIALYIFKR